MKGRVLITGADGFIGSHLVEAAVRAGYSVRALAWYNASGSIGWLGSLSNDILGEVDVQLGDIRDPDLVTELCSDVEGVFHLAALIGIPFSYQAPESYIQTNVLGTLNLLRGARAAGVEKFVQTSTSEVYGMADRFPIDERAEMRAQSPYAASKVASDQLALSFYSSFELPVAVMRPFNTFGPRQSPRAVIPAVIGQMLSGATRIRMGNLDVRREFCYVADTVSGFLAVYQSTQCVGQVVNIGSGFEISVGEIPKLIGSVLGIDVEIELDPQRVRPARSEIGRLLSDTGKAMRLLNWRASNVGVEGFSRGLAETIDWMKSAERAGWHNPRAYAI